MPNEHRDVLVPDYAPPTIGGRTLSKLAVVSLMVSLLVPPFSLPRFLPYSFTQDLIGSTSLGIMILVVPSLFGCALSVFSIVYLRRRPWLSGRSFAVTSLVINALTTFLYVAIGTVTRNLGGPG